VIFYWHMRNSEQAIEKDPNEPQARCVAALVAIFEKDLGRAKAAIDVALSLNPNLAFAYTILGNIHNLSGRPLEAIPLIERAMRLDPAFGAQYLHFLGTAYLLARKYETAAAVLRQRIVLAPETDFIPDAERSTCQYASWEGSHVVLHCAPGDSAVRRS
jgi:adenylate cyclase